MMLGLHAKFGNPKTLYDYDLGLTSSQRLWYRGIRGLIS